MKREQTKEKRGKKKSSFHKTLPIMITLAMILIVLIQSLAMVYMINTCLVEEIDMATIWKACEELFAGNFITLGMSIIAIAVSVWIGLNINVSIEKGELSERIEKLDVRNQKLEDEHKMNIQEFEKERIEVSDAYKQAYEKSWGQLKEEYVDCLKKEWISKILSISEQYPLSGYLGHILKECDLAGNIEFVNLLINYENDYIFVTKLYETEQRDECVAKAQELLSFNIPHGMDSDILKLYFAVRKSDALFYKCACEIRMGAKDENIVQELKQSLDIYHKLERDGAVATYSKRMEVYAYICNTLGYSYDLMNQVRKAEEHKKIAIEYLEKAVVALKGVKGTKRGRYYRNLGLAYQRNERWDDAHEAYEKALLDNPSDNKSYVTLAGIILERIERKLEIKERTKLLSEMTEEFLPYIEDIKYAIELCEESMSISFVFEDPYYKIAQAYTYLFLGTGKQKQYIEEAEKYLHKLQRRGFNRAGYKFTLRNMYEAMGNIQKSIEVNNTIAGTASNDVERIAKLYEDYMKRNEQLQCDEKKERTMGEALIHTPKFVLVDDYSMLYCGLEVANELLKKPELSYDDWSLLKDMVKDYLVDRANRDKEDYTMYTDEIYDWLEELMEELKKREPSKE